MIEENIFKRYVVNYNKLLDYGFKKSSNKYLYSSEILDNSFRVDIEISNDKVIGKVFDLNMECEYDNFRRDSSGEFVNKIKLEFEKVLIDIRNNCFEVKYFASKQANRICDLIKEKYNDIPEFLWDDNTSGVFRNSFSKKWYGIIMNIPRNRITSGEEYVDVINVKLDSNLIVDLLNIKGFYKAYHMNKKYWISIILDDTLSDEVVFDYISKSYLLVSNKKG